MTGRRGFSLIEVVIVMAVIALALSLAGPRIGAGIGRLELERADRTVQSFVKLAKLEAQRTDQGHYVVLNQERQSVVLLSSDLKIIREEKLPSSVRIVLEPPATAASIYVVPSGIVRGQPVRLRRNALEIEVPLG